MTYQSKKDPKVYATLTQKNEKYKTVILTYINGNECGKTINITESTLKRWWKPVESTETTDEECTDGFQESALNIDYEQVSEPYPEPKEQKYIKKPQSVIDYENKKSKKFNINLPKFEEIADVFGSISKKINENSNYIMLNDGGSTIWRKSGFIDVYAVDETAVKLSNAGLISKPNKDKARPFAFRVSSDDEYSSLRKALNV